ncbi:unnamed protein product [Brassicogethes aeneus]|uniref:TTF-type domain-containing protein n=1 Tax=Brassicogethes aeneus TaxID=1431903 RepID=A0A9P0FBF4_BRAAE|nr:unnamed protein product [Brassicogethes aeneus]
MNKKSSISKKSGYAYRKHKEVKLRLAAGASQKCKINNFFQQKDSSFNTLTTPTHLSNSELSSSSSNSNIIKYNIDTTTELSSGSDSFASASFITDKSLLVVGQNKENHLDDEHEIEQETDIVMKNDFNMNLNLSNSEINSFDYPSDPYLFKNTHLDPGKIRELISIGPCQPGLADDYNVFPTCTGNRKFLTSWYQTEGNIRSWLIYSPRVNSLFCFCCWLFNNSNQTVWSDPKNGFKNFKKGPEKISQHEKSHLHRMAYNKLVITKLRLSKDLTVIEQQISKEKLEVTKNREAIKRLIDIILYLAKQSLPLRGHDESEKSQNKGNFLELVNLIKKYDAVLAAHLVDASKVAKYTSNKIQNELIDHLAREVLSLITKNIKEATYFSLIVDSTQDFNKKEQLSLSCRYVNKFGLPEESFLAFINIPDGSAQTYFSTITNELNKLNIDIRFCRGQGYDGASVMSGHINGLQSKVKEIVPEAIYVHCCAHNLNLALVDAASCNAEVKLFFGTLEKTYVFITESFPKVNLFKNIQEKHSENLVKKLTLKKLSTTRWASHLRAVTSFYVNIQVIEETCKKIVSGELKNTTSLQTAEASGILSVIETFEFKFLLCFWKEILTKINILSNYMQNPKLNICTASAMILSTKKCIESIRNSHEKSFLIFKKQATELAMKCGTTTTFANKRIRTKKFHDDIQRDFVIENAEEKFKISMFYTILDVFITTLSSRFKDFISLAQKFSCLVKFQDNEENIKCLMDLQIFYSKDVGTSVIDEYRMFCGLLTEIQNDNNNLSTEEYLPFLISNNLVSSYSALCNLLKIFHTIPNNSAGAERTFSRLNKIINYQRCTMTQERTNNLALLCIESEKAQMIDYDKSPVSRGRPSKSFEEKSQRSRQRDVQPIVLDYSTEQLCLAAETSLVKSGQRNVAQVIKLATETSPRKLKKMKEVHDAPAPTLRPYSPEEALGLIVDLGLTKEDYITIRLGAKERGADIYPSYHLIGEAKKMLSRQCQRLAEVQSDVILENITDNCDTIDIHYKWGLDGHSIYKQNFSNNTEYADSNNIIILCTIVPLQMSQGQKIYWKNPTPSSTRYCRPIVFKIQKENTSNVKEIYSDIESQISKMGPTLHILGNREIKFKHLLICKMLDGKTVNILKDTASSQACNVCKATPKDFNNLEVVTKRVCAEETFKYSISVLHAYLRCYEYLLHIAYKLELRQWQARGEQAKAQVREKKSELATRFYNEMGLVVDQPK